LYIGQKFEPHKIVVGLLVSYDKCGWAHVGGSSILPGKLIEAANDINHHVLNKKFWDTLEWEPMYTRAQALLDCADEAFNLAKVAVCRNNVELNMDQVSMYAGKFVVCMYVTHMETIKRVKFDNSFKFPSVLVMVEETNALQDAVEKGTSWT